MQDLIIICGPTSSGKTALSIEVAKAFDGEIVSADSMQIYRTLDVGTAKITKEEMQGIPHHAIDVVDPDQTFTVAEYSELALNVIGGIRSRGKTPIVVGGTGLYVNSLVFGYDFSKTAQNTELRAELKEFCEREGNIALYERLKSIAPERAERLHPNDVKRVIRAIETAIGGEITEFGGSKSNDRAITGYRSVMIEPDRGVLYDRINKRVDQMLECGLVDEVETAIKNYSLTPEHQSMQAIGYKEWFGYFDGSATIEECTEAIKKATRNYAKRQLTWFRKFPKIRIYNELNVPKIIEELQK